MDPRPILTYHEDMSAYDFGPMHPFSPGRVGNSLDLMRAYGLLDEGGSDEPGTARLVRPEPAGDEQLGRFHSDSYIEAVKEAGSGDSFRPRMGIGTSDNPAFEGMHEAAAVIAGGTIAAVRAVLSGDTKRAYAVGGGLHHAHAARAAGFCIYNDIAVAILDALSTDPDLRVMYVDIDAHHGDGVQDAFWEDDRVLTVSLHQTGETLFPGTGYSSEIGHREGRGYSVNVPMPPLADDDCYELVFGQVVAPLADSFLPDLVIAQCGADAHHSDPLTRLGMTLRGHRSLVRRLVDIAAEHADGRIIATGGGGYEVRTVVPRAWTNVLAELIGCELAEELPGSWTPAGEKPRSLTRDDHFRLPEQQETRVVEATQRQIEETRAALAPYHELDTPAR